MSDFSKKIAKFETNSSKEDKNKNNDKPAQPSKFSGNKRKFIEEINKKTKQEDSIKKPPKPIIINQNQKNIKEKIGKLNQPKNSNNSIEKKEFIDNEKKSSVKDKINALNRIKPKEKPKAIMKGVPKILGGSNKIQNDENPELIIYQYPKLSQFIANYKILLFLGNNNEQYINAFINIFRDICYEDNER